MVYLISKCETKTHDSDCFHSTFFQLFQKYQLEDVVLWQMGTYVKIRKQSNMYIVNILRAVQKAQERRPYYMHIHTIFCDASHFLLPERIAS